MTFGKAAVIAAIALSTGCNGGDPVYFYDNVDLSFNWAALLVPYLEPFTETADQLHGPYVSGSSFTVWVYTERKRLRFDEFTVTSSDPSVFTVENVVVHPGDDDVHDSIELTVHALGDGLADLQLIDGDGEIFDTAPIDVRRPDRAELHAAGPMFVDSSLAPSLTADPHVLNTSVATFQVQWFDGDELLNGNQSLTLEADPSLGAVVAQTYLFEDREWLLLNPSIEGEYAISLLANGLPVQDVTVTVVPPEAVTRIELIGQDESTAEVPEDTDDTATWLTVLGQAFTDDDTPVYGVAYAWNVGGVDEAGYGDLYRYEFDPEQPKTAIAEFNGLSAELDIHAGEGYVDSSNNLGCNTASRQTSTLAIFAALGLLYRRRTR